jgi:hypothetical protein
MVETGSGVAFRTRGVAYPIINLIFLLIFMGGVLLLASLDVTTTSTVRVPWLDRELPSTCIYLAKTGQPCPSCGITRSMITALHGELERSRQFHPAGIPIVCMLLAQSAMRIVFLSRKCRRIWLDVAISTTMLAVFAWLLN